MLFKRSLSRSENGTDCHLPVLQAIGVAFVEDKASRSGFPNSKISSFFFRSKIIVQRNCQIIIRCTGIENIFSFHTNHNKSDTPFTLSPFFFFLSFGLGTKATIRCFARVKPHTTDSGYRCRQKAFLADNLL